MRNAGGWHLHSWRCGVRGIRTGLAGQGLVSATAGGAVDGDGGVVDIYTRERLGDAGNLGGTGVIDRLTDVGGKVDYELSMNYEIIIGFLEIQCKHFCSGAVRSAMPASAHRGYVARCTLTAQFQINNIYHFNIHNAEKPLITFLEFPLVKNLNSDDG